MSATDAVACLHQVRAVIQAGELRANPADPSDLLQHLVAEARVVEIALADWQAIEHDVDGYLRSLPRGSELARYEWPPHPLPFEVVWLGSTSPIPADMDNEEIHLLGFLLAARRAYGFAARRNGQIALFELVDATGRWHASMPGLAFAIAAVLGFMERQAQTMVVRGISPARRRKLRRLTDRRAPPAPIPREYHRIVVRDRVLWVTEGRRAVLGCGPTWSQAHRQDVRGHWRIRVRRGPLPIPAATRATLQARGYTVVGQGTEVPDDLADLLRARGLTLRRAGEWLAILRSWVRSHQRGPEEAPYVPAVWRVRPPAEELIA